MTGGGDAQVTPARSHVGFPGTRRTLHLSGTGQLYCEAGSEIWAKLSELGRFSGADREPPQPWDGGHPFQAVQFDQVSERCVSKGQVYRGFPGTGCTQAKASQYWMEIL